MLHCNKVLLISVLLHSLVYPVQVVNNFSIDSVSSLLSTVNPPADNPSSPESSVIIPQGEGASTVTYTGVPPSFRESSTKHVIRQIWYIVPRLLQIIDWIMAYPLLHHREVHILQLLCYPWGVNFHNSKAWHHSEKKINMLAQQGKKQKEKNAI